MNSMQKRIQKVIQQTLNQEVNVELSRPDSRFGDFSTNVALQLAKVLGKNPREIALALADSIKNYLGEDVSEVTVAGPGFINIKLSDRVLLLNLKPNSDSDSDSDSGSGSGSGSDSDSVSKNNQTTIIETNNPNPFKAMHIGHAFNAILADTIANLLESTDRKVYRVSYHGDVGAHVGKSMYSLLKYVDGDVTRLHDIKPEDRNSFMSRMYAEGATKYKEDESTKIEIDELAKQSFTREDAIYSEVYDMCKNWSFIQIDELVERLGNKPTEKRFLESEADKVGVPIVRQNTPQVFVESEGALVFPGSKYGSFDNVYVTARGLGLYGARDLGLMKLKDDYAHASKSYIVTAEEQKDYFKGVIAAAELCMPEFKDVTTNISTGTVKLSTGKMSSRSGDIVEIAWLFDKVGDAIQNRGGVPTDQFVSAVLRYQFLKVRVGGDVVFDISEAVSIEGNSGPYLQYAHARARSIFRKSETRPIEPASIEQSERDLVAKLGEYQGILSRASTELLPHLICNYLYELAQVFNRFYENNRVIGDKREAERLFFIDKYASTLGQGLNLLGIHAPEEM